MKYFLAIVLALTACIPTPTHYCPTTCSAIGASWRQQATSADPNDPSRLRWCACTMNDRYVLMPPRDPSLPNTNQP